MLRISIAVGYCKKNVRKIRNFHLQKLTLSSSSWS